MYAGADYWRHDQAAMDDINFKYFKVDPDLWMRPGTRYDGATY